MWVDRRFKNDPPPSALGRRIVHVIGRNDKGASVVKHTHSVLDRCRPCSYTAQSVTGTAESLRPKDKPPSDNHANFAATFAATQGFSDLGEMGVVRVGGRHVLVPSHSIPATDLPTHILSDEEAGAFAKATEEENQTGPPAERAARRAEAEVGKAELVFHREVCLGVRTSSGFGPDTCFAFRGEPATAASGETPEQEVLDLVFFYSADLLALATCLGMDNQEGSCCLWCRGGAKLFKIVAAGGAPLPLRTPEPQHADFQKFAADKRKSTKNVNGVKAVSLLGLLPFGRICPPLLHVDLAAEAKAKEEGLTVLEKQSATTLDRALQKALDHYKITVQRYWIGTLVGPDCRRFLENLEGILRRVAAAMLESGGDTPQVRQECEDFVERHMAVGRPLKVALQLLRRVERLNATDQVILKEACAEFGKAWRTSYPDHKILTPKGHLLEVHVPWYCDEFDGWLGLFGEDGLEALHPKDSLCRRLVRQMRNPEARHRAHTLHLAALQNTPGLNREKFTRRRKAAGDAADGHAAANAAAIAAGPLPLPPPPAP
jgi:hypothetical protein